MTARVFCARCGVTSCGVAGNCACGTELAGDALAVHVCAAGQRGLAEIPPSACPGCVARRERDLGARLAS